jgi:hypothetical protein
MIAKEDFNGFMTRVAMLINPPKPKTTPPPDKNEKDDGI